MISTDYFLLTIFLFQILFLESLSTFSIFSGHNCARSSGAVHSVFLIDVYLDLENPRGSGFWVGENRRVTEGNREGQFATIRERRWADPDTEEGAK
jgi:hypothetical protein